MKKFKLPLILLGILVALYILLRLIPYPGLYAFMNRQNSTRFYDRNGVLLHILPLEDGLRREYYSLSEIPEDLVKRFVSEEDEHFYWHRGVDFVSVLRALWQNQKAGQVVSGASTITMQLVRLIRPRTRAVTKADKVKEMFCALWLEIKLSKKQILELYLNSVPFGYQTEGVGSAARAFFSEELTTLSSAQIETLSKIPRRPSDYAPPLSYTYTTACPHFIAYVVLQYKQEKKRIPNSLTLSIDSDLVSYTEKMLQQKVKEFKEARVHNGAAFAVDNTTGEILLWVGNTSFYDEEHSGQIDGVLVKNQPGSSMKPFLYALSLEKGFTPSAVLPDIQQDFGGSGVYVPLNFNNRFNGPVLFRVSLASSLNVPAVYLLYSIGVDAYMERLLTLGFTSLEGKREEMGLSLALGAGEVTLYEMVRAFTVFANDGFLISSPSFLKTSPRFVSKKKRVFSVDTARIICDILSDSSSRELGFGHAAVFNTDYPSIFKTGTSNQFQNIIALGSTTEYTVGVWMGNFAGETVIKQTGSSIPAGIVRSVLDIFSESKEYREPSDFAKPDLYVKESVCALSGMYAGKDCPARTMEYVQKSRKSQFEASPCTWHYFDGTRVSVRYPSEYQHWANSRNLEGSIAMGSSSLSIHYPKNNALFIYDPSVPQAAQELHVQAFGGSSDEAELYVDGVSVGKAQGLFVWHIPLERGEHTLLLSCADESAICHYTVR